MRSQFYSTSRPLLAFLFFQLILFSILPNKAVSQCSGPVPSLVLNQPPAAVCSPETIDLTAQVNLAASTLPEGTVLSYYNFSASGFPVANPSAVNQSGTYTIIATAPNNANGPGCSDQKTVVVTIY